MVAEISHIFLVGAHEIPIAPDERENADYLTTQVARARAGDTVAFERIMIATEQRVVSIAWRMLGNRDDARDAAQEVFLRVFKYLDRFRAGDDFRPWLYRITINVCRDFSRRKRHTIWLDDAAFTDEDVTSEIVNPNADPETLALHAQQLSLIRRAVRALPEKERAALVLRDLEGLSTEEVAQALGSRPVTVRSQVSSARAKLKLYCERFSSRKGMWR